MNRNFNYVPVCEFVFSNDIGYYRTFGLKVFDNGVLYTSVPDISADENVVSHLAQLCMDEQPDPVHLYDVIEDFLVSPKKS